MRHEACEEERAQISDGVNEAGSESDKSPGSPSSPGSPLYRRSLSPSPKWASQPLTRPPSNVMGAMRIRKFTEQETHRREIYTRHVQVVSDSLAALESQAEEAQEKRHMIHQHRTIWSMTKRVLDRQCTWLECIFAAALVYQTQRRIQITKAKEALKRYYVPLWRMRHYCKMRVWDRNRRREEQLQVTMPFNPALLASHECLSLLNKDIRERLARKMVLQCFAKGQWMYWQGEPASDMCVISEGTVQLFIGDPGSKTRCAQPLSTHSRGTFLGTFEMICGEVRDASVLCTTDVDVWTLNKEVYAEMMRKAPTDELERLRAVVSGRRLNHMRLEGALKPSHLQRLKFFESWEPQVLQRLMSSFEPLATFPGDIIQHEGLSLNNSMFYISRGTLRLSRNDPVHGFTDLGTVTTGTLIGTTACLISDMYLDTIECLVPCEIWRLPRAKLVDFLLGHTVLFAAMKAFANAERASKIAKLPLNAIHGLTALKVRYPLYFKTIGEELYVHLTPHIWPRGAEVAQEGDPCTNVIWITKGEMVNQFGNRFGRGTVLGSVEIFSGIWPATLTCDVEVECWSLSAQSLQKYLTRQAARFGLADMKKKEEMIGLEPLTKSESRAIEEENSALREEKGRRKIAGHDARKKA